VLAEATGGDPAPYIRRPDEFGSFNGFKPVLHVKPNSVADTPVAKNERKYPVLLYNHGGSWSRFTAIDHHGRLFGQSLSTGTSRPVMLMHAGSEPTADAMAELVARVRQWDSAFRARSTGEVYDVTLARTDHGNFSDLTLFFPRDDKLMDPRRAHEIILAYTEAFFDRYLRGKPTSDLLKGPASEYPEVTFVKK
jgi:hypothetical protein